MIENASYIAYIIFHNFSQKKTLMQLLSLHKNYVQQTQKLKVVHLRILQYWLLVKFIKFILIGCATNIRTNSISIIWLTWYWRWLWWSETLYLCLNEQTCNNYRDQACTLCSMKLKRCYILPIVVLFDIWKNWWGYERLLLHILLMRQ